MIDDFEKRLAGARTHAVSRKQRSEMAMANNIKVLLRRTEKGEHEVANHHLRQVPRPLDVIEVAIRGENIRARVMRVHAPDRRQRECVVEAEEIME